MTYSLSSVAVGGTFDRIHKGHRALISKAFEVGEFVHIGVTSDEFAKEMGKTVDNRYDARVSKLKELIEKEFPGRRYEIRPLKDYFGEKVLSDAIEGIVVSEETLPRVRLANEIRASRGIKSLRVVVTEMVRAEDGKRISTTRIRKREIDEGGRVLRERGE